MYWGGGGRSGTLTGLPFIGPFRCVGTETALHHGSIGLWRRSSLSRKVLTVPSLAVAVATDLWSFEGLRSCVPPLS